jgi:signal transduction histidine kinase
MMRWTALRHPDGAWGWGAGAAAVGVVVAPQLVVQAIVPQAHTTAAAAAAAGLVLNVVAVTSGIFMYLHHRLTRSDSTAWLAAGLIFTGGFGLTVTGLDTVRPADRPPAAPLIVAEVAVVLALLAMVRISERVTLTYDPAALGLVLALAGSALAILLAAIDGLTLPQPATALLTVPLVVTAAVVAAEVRRLVTLPGWVRNRLAAAIIALFVGQACLLASGSGAAPANTLSVLASTAAAALFLGTSLATLRLAINDDRQAITALQDEIASTAAHAEADRERLHEVKGTIAGIASASRLIHHAPPLPGPRRELLEEMLERESARLQRLVQGGTLAAPAVTTIDDVLRPLVVGRRAQGQTVSWRGSPIEVWAREDDLTEVLNILLDNTARHAPGAAVAVFTRETVGHVEVVVVDGGPGVPPEQRAALFERGARGSGSTGEGLGLYVARRLAERTGGYLRHDPSWRPGAAFVVGVRRAAQPVRGRRHDAVRIAAQ